MKGLFHALKGKRHTHETSVDGTVSSSQELLHSKQDSIYGQELLSLTKSQHSLLSSSDEIMVPARQLSATTGTLDQYMRGSAPAASVPPHQSPQVAQQPDIRSSQQGQQLTERNVARTASALYQQVNTIGQPLSISIQFRLYTS
jgi:hypothetical protein